MKNSKNVYLNGFLESRKYMESLTGVKYVGSTKSEDGYSIIECYETTEN